MIGKESRLFRGCYDAMFSKCVENEINMLLMLLYQIQEDGDVILIICIPQIYFPMNYSFDKKFQDLILPRKWSMVLYSSLIELSIIMDDA